MHKIKWMSVKSVVNNQVLEDEEGRSPFLRGYGSIIHRSQFRRLSDKTQVYIHRKTDYLRTRLTHSIEVEQIGRQLARIFCVELGVKSYLVDGQQRENFYQDFEDLTASACLIHDIGHPPFGHTGEEALQEITTEKNLIFESNRQNIRLLLGSEIRRPYNVTYSLVDAVMKYKDGTFNDHSKKYPGYYLEEKEKVEKIIETTKLRDIRHPICYLMEAADDIAYICGDLEDSIKLEQSNRIDKKELIEKLKYLPFIEQNENDWESCVENNFEDSPYQITSCVMKTLVQHCYNVIKYLNLKEIFKDKTDQFPLKLRDKIKQIQCENEKLNLLYCKSKSNDQVGDRIYQLKDWVYKEKILKSSLLAKECLSAQRIVRELFEVLFEGLTKDLRKSSDFEKNLTFLILPSHIQKEIKKSKTDRVKIARWICDYISGMTNSFAISLWEQLYTPHTLKKDSS